MNDEPAGPDDPAGKTTKRAGKSKKKVITPEDLIEWVEMIVSRLESVDHYQGQFWCPQWWEHTEAVDRFRALFERWLDAQANDGMSSWWVDHYDRHAPILFAKTGPFGDCADGHEPKAKRRMLACEMPDPDWAW